MAALVALVFIVAAAIADAALVHNCTLPGNNADITICAGNVCEWQWTDAAAQCEIAMGSNPQDMIKLTRGAIQPFSAPGEFFYTCNVFAQQSTGRVLVVPSTYPECAFHARRSLAAAKTPSPTKKSPSPPKKSKTPSAPKKAPASKTCTCAGKCYGYNSCGTKFCSYPTPKKGKKNSVPACSACCKGLPFQARNKCVIGCKHN